MSKRHIAQTSKPRSRLDLVWITAPYFFLFQQKSFFYKLCYAIATTKVSVMKYQAVWLIAVSIAQGGKRLGDETSSPLFKRCVMRRRTGTSALSALPVRLVAGKIHLSTNRKSHFLSLFFSQPCTMIKTFFHSPGSQLKVLMSAWTIVNLFHSKFPKNALNLRVSNACSCRKTWHGCLSSSILKKLQITPP